MAFIIYNSVFILLILLDISVKIIFAIHIYSMIFQAKTNSKQLLKLIPSIIIEIYFIWSENKIWSDFNLET